MLSGIGPADQLRRFGIPTLRDAPGVGENLWNHLSAQVTFKVKDGISLATHTDAAHFSLHYTADGSPAINDMVLRTTPMVDPRQERVPGVRTKYLNGDVPPDRVARISCTLGLPDGAGLRQARLGRPGRPAGASTIAISSIRTTFAGSATDCGWRSGCWHRTPIATWSIYRIHPTDEVLADDAALDRWIRQTVGSAPARVGHLQDGTGHRSAWRSSTRTAGSRASGGFGWSMPR